MGEWLAASGKEGLPSHCPRVSLALLSPVPTYGSETHSAKYNDVYSCMVFPYKVSFALSRRQKRVRERDGLFEVKTLMPTLNEKYLLGLQTGMTHS